VLSQRRADILNLVVDEYIDTATPVSSRALVDRHHLDLSTATVRNELARLEDDGYITHPYTSAGRVPSNVGYRFYVERLMAEQPVGPAEQRTIEHQFHQASPGYDDWLRLAATILAAAVGNVAVVARPQRALPRLRHAQLVQLRPGAALLVAVMDDGSVQERIVAVPEPESQQRLTARAERLNDHCAQTGAGPIRALASDLDDEYDRRLALDIAELLDEHAAAAELYIEGVRPALEQPEFDSTDRILDAVQHLEAYHLRDALRSTGEARSGARTLIGDENPENWLHDWTIVVSGFDGPDGAIGTVAVLGPTRMRYGHTIPRVRYVAALMSDLLQEIEG
jgi:heat-inducible transcriptional repressor